MRTSPSPMSVPLGPGAERAAWIVVVAGIGAAAHVGKLPPAIAALQATLNLSLLQAGFLLSMVQLAGMSMGLLLGLVVDRIGLRRSMLIGLGLLAAASAAGAGARTATPLLVLRAVEGLGFMLVALSGPAQLRRLLPAARLTHWMAIWSVYMPVGTALVLLGGPLVIGAALRWPLWWGLIAALTVVMMLGVWRGVPPDSAFPPLQPHGGGPAFAARLRAALGAPGPWLLALTFGVYAAQWMALIGFLPSIYQQAGIHGALLGALTAGVALVNIIGNLSAGVLLQRGLRALPLMGAGFAMMALGAWLAFADHGGAAALRYGGALLFSSFGGVVPGALFALAPLLAPTPALLAPTVGWMMQGSAIGQFVGPPVVAWLAGQVGGWQWTWAATGSCCLAGVALAALIGRRLRGAAAQSAP